MLSVTNFTSLGDGFPFYRGKFQITRRIFSSFFFLWELRLHIIAYICAKESLLSLIFLFSGLIWLSVCCNSFIISCLRGFNALWFAYFVIAIEALENIAAMNPLGRGLQARAPSGPNCSLSSKTKVFWLSFLLRSPCTTFK